MSEEAVAGQTDTIAAIATGMTQAGIGIIRISGPDSFSVADRIFRGKTKQKVTEYASHTLHLGYIIALDTAATAASGKEDEKARIDEVLLSVFRAPHSYTGEDTVEINCHGGTYLCRRVLDIVLRNGARPAEPGEFTKRAFLNGRMDLSQAEAVMDLIASKNDFAIRNSVTQLGGSVRDKIRDLRERILHEIAYIEAALDDPEHYDLTDYPQELDQKVDTYSSEIGELLHRSENGRLRRDGIRTAILGKPNAGKSSVLNFLSGHESAIVTDIAGTTRDAIEESVRLGELQLNLVDTAGIRDAENKVEQIGVERARKIASEADLILYVVDSSVPLDENDRSIFSLLKDRPVVILYNKSDLTAAVTEDELRKELVSGKEYPIVSISAKEETGLQELQQTLSSLFLNEEVTLNDEIVITNLRQQGELRQTQDSMQKVREAIADGMPEDFFSIDLTDAYRHLGFIIGEELSDDIADKIFSEFCMGK